MAVALALGSLLACGGRQVARPGPLIPPGCEILPKPASGPDTVTVALLDAIEPGRAPWAGNAGERLVFGHLYETLITVDCLEVVRAGLAESWKSGKGGRRWTFELRRDARFWDGAPVTARDVEVSWRDALTLGTVIDSAAATGDHTLQVYLKRRHRGVPRELSASVFAVTKPDTDSRWLLGTGPYRIDASADRSLRMTRRQYIARPAFGARGPVIRFVETPAAGARDALESGIDVMITVDPAVIDYATARSQFAMVALPWDKTYVLLSTSRADALRERQRLGEVSPRLSEGLARDAVRGDARGYRSPSWWDDLRHCGELSTSVSRPAPGPRATYTGTGLRRILYDLNDPVARDLAERIVALAATDPAVSPEAAALTALVPGLTGNEAGMNAEGVTTGELGPRLRRGRDFAYVIAIPRRPPAPCYEARELMNRAPWLAPLGSEFPRALIPLVDTRPHAIARHEETGLVADWYGSVVIANGMARGK